jgi:predicted porin
VGAVTLKASLVNRKDSAKMGNQFALGAVYDLSKRTSVYATYAALKNETGLGNTVGSALVTNFTGVNSKGFETGIKHSF